MPDLKGDYTWNLIPVIFEAAEKLPILSFFEACFRSKSLRVSVQIKPSAAIGTISV